MKYRDLLKSLLRNVSKEYKKNFLIIIVLLILGFGVRLLPHAPNFTPVGAIALFAGLYLSKKLALIIPLIIMFLSDLLIGFYSWPIMVSVYLSFLIMVVIGLSVKRKISAWSVIGGTLLGSVIFFLFTNAAVWAFGTMYAKNFSGLIQSYIMALPFFRNTIASNMVYTGVLVGGVELVRYSVAHWVKKAYAYQRIK